jgi:hypothetical protein
MREFVFFESKRSALDTIYNNLLLCSRLITDIENSRFRTRNEIFNDKSLKDFEAYENKCILDLAKLKGLLKPSDN